MFSMRIFRSIGITLVFLSCDSFAGEGIYKWKDKYGDTHYGEKPPTGLKAETITLKSETTSIQNSMVSKPVSIEKSKANEITRYVLRANEKTAKRTRWASKLIISNNILWLTFKNSILEFNLNTEKSKKYNLNHIQDALSTHNMHISGDYFVFLNINKKLSQSVFHVYNYKNNTIKTLPISSNPDIIYSYDDKYNDGIFSFDYKQNTLIQYNNIKNLGKVGHASEKKYISNGNNTGSLSTSENTIWQTSGNKKNCSVSFFDKKTGNAASFNHKEIGLSASNTCGSIVADNNEVWVSSLARKFNTTFSIYNINNKTWENIKKSKNNIPLNQSSFQMDSEYIYYYSCEKLIAMNRVTKNASILTTDTLLTSKKRYCISDYKIHDNNAWVLKFEDYRNKITPVLYKISLNRTKKNSNKHSP